MRPLVIPAALVLLTGVLPSLSASRALAQQAPATTSRPTPGQAARAAAHVDRGRKLYDLRRWDKAIAEFELAYQLDADPNHLYNIAQAHRLATHIDKAIQYYQAYLDKLPGAPNRADVEGRIAELQKARRPPNTLEPAPGSGAPPVLSGPPLALPDDPPPVLPGESTYAPPAWQGGPQPAPYPVGAPAPLLGDPGAAPPYPYYPGYPPPGAPGVAASAPASASSTSHRHDGVFARLQAGPGYLLTNMKDRGLRLKGPGAAFALALGGTVASQLAIFAELGLGFLPSPVVTEYGDKSDLSERLLTFSYAVGAALFLDPHNVYLSLSVGAADLRGKGGYKSKVGGGATASAGKEWWVTDQLGVGAALQIHASIVEDSDTGNAAIGTTWLAAVLSATFN